MRTSSSAATPRWSRAALPPARVGGGRRTTPVYGSDERCRKLQRFYRRTLKQLRACPSSYVRQTLGRELREQAMDSEQALDTAVRLEVYRFFVDQGRPPVPAEVAETLATDQVLS
jgi:hypothetical protein